MKKAIRWIAMFLIISTLCESFSIVAYSQNELIDEQNCFFQIFRTLLMNQLH